MQQWKNRSHMDTDIGRKHQAKVMQKEKRKEHAVSQDWRRQKRQQAIHGVQQEAVFKRNGKIKVLIAMRKGCGSSKRLHTVKCVFFLLDYYFIQDFWCVQNISQYDIWMFVIFLHLLCCFLNFTFMPFSSQSTALYRFLLLVLWDFFPVPALNLPAHKPLRVNLFNNPGVLNH